MSQAPRPLSLQAAQRLILDTEPFLSCDDCFDLVDRYVEALLSDPSHDHPAMRIHLAGCAACAEEARSLMWLVAEERGLDPAPALRHLGDGPA
ncbi:hypothetical protein DDP54_05750 [Cellulomonas sp. WB94]|uniref:hypothetical protein n=1 Tax=Cellulomonas sp. WB94 TaxID=2173174 RepID=UPI000D5827EE|nr:hypothetical protein [Cellulomonas sp. WB94]PVU82584.1 hypothetical protein DDP54_05750 [Cellulomonas sp. WB94]